jgi:ferrochelatase
MTKRVILVNYGAYTTEKDIKPFLRNLFSDEILFPLPPPLRKLLGFLISELRFKEGKRILEAMEGKSPLLEQTEEQKKLLQQILGKEYHLQVAMRYSEPLLENVLRKTKKGEKLIIFPLFPHYSVATYGSIEKVVKKALKNGHYFLTKPFYHCEGFVKGWVEAIVKILEKAKKPFLLFSAHSLPLYLVKRFNDPYSFQIEESAKLIASRLGLPYKVSYQSRLGPVKWLQPSTEEVLKELASKGVKEVVVIPISFVAENSETIVEIDITYKKLAEELGIEHFIRVPIPYNSPHWIDCFKELIEEAGKRV